MESRKTRESAWPLSCESLFAKDQEGKTDNKKERRTVTMPGERPRRLFGGGHFIAARTARVWEGVPLKGGKEESCEGEASQNISIRQARGRGKSA